MHNLERNLNKFMALIITKTQSQITQCTQQKQTLKKLLVQKMISVLALQNTMSPKMLVLQSLKQLLKLEQVSRWQPQLWQQVVPQALLQVLQLLPVQQWLQLLLLKLQIECPLIMAYNKVICQKLCKVQQQMVLLQV